MISLPPPNEHQTREREPERRATTQPAYVLTAACEGLHVAARAKAQEGRRAYAAGMRAAALRIEEIIGRPDAPPKVLSARISRAVEAVEAVAVELERAGYTQTEIKLALDGARQERMK